MRGLQLLVLCLYVHGNHHGFCLLEGEGGVVVNQVAVGILGQVADGGVIHVGNHIDIARKTAGQKKLVRSQAVRHTAQTPYVLAVQSSKNSSNKWSSHHGQEFSVLTVLFLVMLWLFVMVMVVMSGFAR